MNGGMNTGGMNGAMGGYQPDPYANQAVAAPQSQAPRANQMQMQQQLAESEMAKNAAPLAKEVLNGSE